MLLFVIALAANWKNTRRNLLICGFTLFLIGGAVAGLFLEPEFAKQQLGTRMTLECGFSR